MQSSSRQLFSRQAFSRQALSKQASSRQFGFTLIELVIVIIILGILSLTAISRFNGPSSYSAHAAQAQAMSIIRQIQTGRMQSSATTASADNFILTVTADCLGSKKACSENNGESSAIVNLSDQNMRFSPAKTITFDLLGRPTDLCNAAGQCSGQHSITIVSEDAPTLSRTICINAQGFVYQPTVGGVCDK